MPVYDFNEVHSVMVQTEANHIFWAIKEVTPLEIPLLRTLFWIRSLPARLTGGGGPGLVGAKPLLEQFINGGFVPLAEEPHRELVLGTIGQFWRLRGGVSPEIAGAQDFLMFDHPDYAKATLNFL